MSFSFAFVLPVALRSSSRRAVVVPTTSTMRSIGRYLSHESSSSDRGGTTSKPLEDPSSSTTKTDWRKQQLEKLEKRFAYNNGVNYIDRIQNDEDLQPMWREMESRVSNRRSRTLEQNNFKIGRTNIRKTDEDLWLQEGLYDNGNETSTTTTETEEEKK